MTKEEKMREVLQFIADNTEHGASAGNEYRFPIEIEINRRAKEALSYQPGDRR